MLNLWGIHSLDMDCKYNTVYTPKFGIRVESWRNIFNGDAFWMGKLANYWQVCNIGDLKMYKYDESTQVLDRLMLQFLVDPFGFLSMMWEEIEETSLETRKFFQIIEAAINGDLRNI